ncbi:MAG: family 43 glycosylhydrolase, partial [Bacteroidales bacterium]|nr:family 43 glycosylhydrolase [Bacteroidales bacterium]
MKDKTLLLAASGVALLAACGGQEQAPTFDAPQTTLTTIGNPFIPLWDHIPDGEPYVFEDPDNPGKFRVYLYGSHDIEVKNYCGRDQVVWSADVNDLNHWRMDGVILKVDKNGKGEPQKEADVLFAPDVTLKVDKDGKKTYYLYPNNQVGGRNGMVAKSNRPDGPFEVINWSKANPDTTDGVLKFDPAVFVDDDGKVYGYWGFGTSHVAELDPETMAT